MGWLRRIISLLLVGLGFSMAWVVSSYARDVEKASGPVTGLIERYPGGSIDSIEMANEVLQSVKNEREAIKVRFENTKQECYRKFLVNDCIDQANEQSRIDRAALKNLDIEANRFKRSEIVRQRDQVLDERRAREEEDAPKREESKQKYEEKELKSQKRIEAAEEKAEKSADTEPETPQAVPGAKELTPAERAQNLEKYRQKQVTSEKRKLEVEKKKEKTQQKRARKAEEEAQKAQEDAKRTEAAAKKAQEEQGTSPTSSGAISKPAQ